MSEEVRVTLEEVGHYDLDADDEDDSLEDHHASNLDLEGSIVVGGTHRRRGSSHRRHDSAHKCRDPSHKYRDSASRRDDSGDANQSEHDPSYEWQDSSHKCCDPAHKCCDSASCSGSSSSRRSSCCSCSSSSSSSRGYSRSGSSAIDDDSQRQDDEIDLPYPGFRPVTMFCLTQTSRPRNLCLRIVTNPYPFICYKCALYLSHLLR
ncbi:hypothetical protein JTE90_009023 [Oedothorax gibbosus]|uniref:Uncharacterized protein n=1 Tax=Oedothorax gibbosus TaxID=931172 RepID=A0AAV6VJW5_9ARAC|nr:hypothetical protein JTE90_009023 [Oedothorax gibbosus]